ncbi:hypothetical protein KKA23_01440 [Patescibacteria group bacterium]|nr:hypothetical protein [Patescibacteria group bacterium]MBU3923269.1 hypothetical protein [Patescibacteria group bacterium]
MVDTVGSLTQLQRSMIIGSVLGDGYLRIVPGRKNAFLEINHSFKQKEYVDWKYSVLKNISISPPKKRNNSGNRISYRFNTKQSTELTEIYNLFYKNGKKIIPKEIKLDPVILSVWFMDDGSRCRESDFYLNTQQFSVKEQKILVSLLKNIGLHVRMNKDKNYYRLRFLKDSIPKLINLIQDNIVSSMKYKIEL